jgi:outer membrane receptor protein involved in Fe transport
LSHSHLLHLALYETGNLVIVAKGISMRKYLIPLLLSLYFFIPRVAEADTSTSTTLPPVTVTASKGTDLESMDVSTTVITRDEVQQSPEISVDQIVNKIPGIFIPQAPSSQLHPTGGTFNIRGFGTSTNVNTLVLVDGIPANDPYFRTVDWTKIPKDSIERIEVIRGGGASSLWGNLAMGGIVNIITREPEAGDKRFNLSYGSFNTFTGDAAVTVFANERFKLSLGVNEVRSDGYNKTPAEFRNPAMTDTAAEIDNFPASLYFTPSDDSKYYLKFQAHSARERGLVWEKANNTWASLAVSGGGTTKLAGGGSINMSGWYDDGKVKTQNVSLENNGAAYTFNIFDPDVGVPYVSQTESARYRSASAAVFYSDNWGAVQDVKIGIDGRDITSRDPLQIFTVSGKQTAAIVAKGEHRFQGIFGQGTYRPDSLPLDVTLGLREDFWQPVNARISGTVNDNMLSNPLKDGSSNHFDPRLGAKYYFDNGLDIRGALYENFAAPGMNQMYRSFISGSSYTAPSPDLDPQTNFGQEIGLGYKQPGGEISLTFFHNKLDGFIDYAGLCTTAESCADYIAGTGIAPGSISRVNQYVNAGDAVFQGIELLGNWNATDNLVLTGGVTRTDAYLTSSDYGAADPTDQQIGQVPKWLATLGGNWKPVDKLTLGVQLKEFPSYWNNTSHTQKNDSAVLADVSLAYSWTENFEIYVVAQNIGNFDYYDQGHGVTESNGSEVNPSTIPSLGLPFSATVGIKAEF